MLPVKTQNSSKSSSSFDTQQSQGNDNQVKSKILNSSKVRCYKNKKFQYASISIGIVLVIAAVAVFCAIYFRDHSKIEVRIVKSGSAQVQGQEIKYHQYDLNLTFKDASQSKMTLIKTDQVSVVKTKDDQGQEVNKEVQKTCYSATLEGLHQNYRYCNHDSGNDEKTFSYQTQIDQDFLLDLMKKSDDDSLRLLQEEGAGYLQQFTISQQDGQVAIKNKVIDELNEQLQSEQLQIEIQILKNVDTQNQNETVYDNNQNYSFSVKTKDLENPTQTDLNHSDDQTKGTKNNRMLRFRWKKLIKTVVNVVKKAGPVIGAVVGGVVGGILGGPAGAAAGIQLGMEIGSAAKAIADTCLPTNSQGNVYFKCDASKAVQNTGLYVAGQLLVPKDAVKNISYSIIKKVI